MIAIERRKRFDRYIIRFSRKWTTVGNGKSPPLRDSGPYRASRFLLHPIGPKLNHALKHGGKTYRRFALIFMLRNEKLTHVNVQREMWVVKHNDVNCLKCLNNAWRSIKIIGCKWKEKEREGANLFFEANIIVAMYLTNHTVEMCAIKSTSLRRNQKIIKCDLL